MSYAKSEKASQQTGDPAHSLSEEALKLVEVGLALLLNAKRERALGCLEGQGRYAGLAGPGDG